MSKGVKETRRRDTAGKGYCW